MTIHIQHRRPGLKLPAFKRLAELPSSGDGTVADDGASVTGGHAEGEALAGEVRVALPVLAPVPGHRLPPGFRPLDRDGVHVSGAAHVADEHEVEVVVAVDCEPDPSLLMTGYPTLSKSKTSRSAAVVIRFGSIIIIGDIYDHFLSEKSQICNFCLSSQNH
ncbi:uncharacterized protein A4U43_C05F5490 [Asparagus officinalis]|uniref:Uncharacterized protein n=1 Tax=Asparagus officinalis TaxID=4686 RepID=A0A5P1EPK2_ASPOF|nr:uncharacterized protein A4U43_C05F5490 [Asparagus officinalis]